MCARKGFRGGPFLDVSGTMQLLNSDHVRERDKALLRGVLVGCGWNGFLLEKVRNCHVPCRFCGGDDHDGHLFWDCPFPPLVEIRENPEFHELMEMAKSYFIGLDACFGMGGYLCSLVLIWVLLERWILLRVLVIFLIVLWVLTLRLFCWIGVYLLALMLNLLLFMSLENLMLD